jgi:hypothetical protein
MDIDFVRYLLNFPTINVAVSKNGDWSILIKQDCIYFDDPNKECKIHNKPEQPKTCAYFIPYQCNYKLNLDKSPSTIYILGRETFDTWVQAIKFDDNGQLIAAPSFEQSEKILANINSKKK